MRYVALLAFNQIVLTHPVLVSAHQDAILGCIDDLDISIRLQALDLAGKMVNSNNLTMVVARLIDQLQTAPLDFPQNNELSDHHQQAIEPAADSDSEDPEEALRPTPEKPSDTVSLPSEYRISTMRRILAMCSKDMYANITDFEWYIETLAQLGKLVPLPDATRQASSFAALEPTPGDDTAKAIGLELQNLAVRVDAVRPEVVMTATSFLSTSGSDNGFPNISIGGRQILQHAAWVVGEYASHVPDPSTTMADLIHPRILGLPSHCLCSYLFAIPKILIAMTSHDRLSWTPERKSMVSLLLARVIYFLEPLAPHPDLEVQNRAVELLELLRLTAQAVSDHVDADPHGPLLLTSVLPSLYGGEELKPVAADAQGKIPVPEDLDLDTPINSDLATILRNAGGDVESGPDDEGYAEVDRLYHERPAKKAIQGSIAGPAVNLLRPPEDIAAAASYQQSDDLASDPETVARKRLERKSRHQDDPYYIGKDDDRVSGTSTPFHDILHTSNGDDVDVDSIPIMDLHLGGDPSPRAPREPASTPRKRKVTKSYQIAPDETVGFSSSAPAFQDAVGPQPPRSPLSTSPSAAPRSGLASRSVGSAFLSVDSSHIVSLSLDPHDATGLENGTQGEGHGVYRTDEEEAEMAHALREVERIRLELQRAQDQVEMGAGVDPAGTVVRRKKKKRKKMAGQAGEEDGSAAATRDI